MNKERWAFHIFRQCLYTPLFCALLLFISGKEIFGFLFGFLLLTSFMIYGLSGVFLGIMYINYGHRWTWQTKKIMAGRKIAVGIEARIRGALIFLFSFVASIALMPQIINGLYTELFK